MSSYFGTIEEVEAARAKRRKEIQEWARADQAYADAALLGVPTSFDNDWDLVRVEPELEVPESATPETEVTSGPTLPRPADEIEPDETPVTFSVDEPKTAPKTTKTKTATPK